MGSDDGYMTLQSGNGCGCAGCSGENAVNVHLKDANSHLGLLGGDEGIGAPVATATPEQFSNYLTNGFWQDFYGSSATFSGHVSNSLTFSISSSYSASQKAGIRMAFDLWEDVANISFTEVASGGDIPVITNMDNRAFASNTWSYQAGEGAYEITSTGISIDHSQWYWTNFNAIGDYALQTIIHEIGHAIGLGHSGNYNAGQGNPTYNNDAIWTNDTRQYTAMSYFSASNSGANHGGEYGSSPLLYDVMAVQSLYGANTSTRSGNTTYGFNSNAGRDIYDFTVTTSPVVTIWDGGGTDTLDLSGYSNTQTITLVAGDFSSVGGLTSNLSIAYGATIENATGGTGNDTIYGNDSNNTILGNNGNDSIYGSAGDDSLDGGAGTDTVFYSYNLADFLISLVDSVTVIFENVAQSYSDTLANFESYNLNGTVYTYADIVAQATPPSEFVFAMKWSGGIHYHTSYGTENTTYTAAQMGYGGAGGNVYNIARTVSSTTINILNTSAPSTLQIFGEGTNDVFAVNGNHGFIGVSFRGRDGDDSLSIASTITGVDYIYGEGGNDTISSSGGNDYLYGGAGDDVLNGEAGADRIYGGNDTDTINGGDGNDYLYGELGNDTVNGDAGNDFIYGNDGNDELNGGDGFDRLYGGEGVDTISGGAQNDTITGGAGDDILNGDGNNDKIWGDAGNDTINGGTHTDTLDGGIGNDTINGGQGIDYLYGRDGDDIMDGGSENDTLFGHAGTDTMNGGTGGDYLNGGNDGDTMNGGEGFDSLYGEAGNDIMNGDAGNDFMVGGTGNDTMDGGADVDKLYGGTGNDTLSGGTGNDLLNGQADNDRLEGGAGADVLYGEAGLDTLIGGAGLDKLYGGAGADIFGFSASEDSDDRIYDFIDGADILNITDLLTGYVHGSSNIADFARLIHRSGSFDLQVDRNGGGNSWERVAKVFTDLNDATTAQDLLTAGTLVANQTLV